MILIRTMSRVAVIVLVGGLSLALPGCGATQDVEPGGSWGQDAQGQPHLELTSDGSFTGTDGCNRLGGSWEAEGDQVTFSGVFQTMMACEDVDTWLSGLASATVTSQFLVVRNEDGEEIGTLQRDG